MIYIGDVLKLIDDEPEYPNAAPPRLMALINEAIRDQDADQMLHMLRASVRLTKLCIRERLEAMADEQQSLIITQYPSLGTNASRRDLPNRF